MQVTLYHNPRCSKSRAALALLEERAIEPRIVRYLDDPPSATDLAGLVSALGTGTRSLLRTSEPEYRELGLDDESLTDAELLDAMARHPKLIQRPVLVAGAQARIGRPPEAILDILP